MTDFSLISKQHQAAHSKTIMDCSKMQTGAHCISGKMGPPLTNIFADARLFTRPSLTMYHFATSDHVRRQSCCRLSSPERKSLHIRGCSTAGLCHLPLIVPPDCGFRVGTTTIKWEEGKVIAFDDSVEHEAWNNSAFYRLVLIFDIWRPELTQTERDQITAIFDVVDNYR